jgi:hypothetical protein
VDDAKNIAEQRGVVGVLFELYQLQIENRETFVGLGEKFTEQVIHCHVPKAPRAWAIIASAMALKIRLKVADIL